MPFVTLARQADHPLILLPGRFLPPAVVTPRLIDARRAFRPLADGPLHAGADGWPMSIASLRVVTRLRRCGRHALPSLVGGTAADMTMVQPGATP